MLKHLALVEDWWCAQWLHGRAPEPPWDSVDWDADADWDWHSAAQDTPEQLHALWQEAVARSRLRVAEALAEGGPDRLAKRSWPDGRAPSLRWILCHLIEEYARHNGHADLLRESLDGLDVHGNDRAPGWRRACTVAAVVTDPFLPASGRDRPLCEPPGLE